MKKIFFFLFCYLFIVNISNAQETIESPEVEIRLGQIGYEMQQLRGKIEILEYQILNMKNAQEETAQNLEYRLNALEMKNGINTPLLKKNNEKGGNKKENEKGKTLYLIDSKQPSAIEEYENAIKFFQEKKYELAIESFISFLDREPKNEKSSQAQFLLAESYFKIEDKINAALNFVKIYEVYPTSKEAPESLLRLAKTLFMIKQKKEACGSLRTLLKKYPDALSSIKTHAKENQKKNGCM